MITKGDSSIGSVSEQQVQEFRDGGAFDEAWYLCEYPDVARSGLDPALHYLWIGKRLGRQPSGKTKTTVPLSMNVAPVTTSAKVSQFENTWQSSFAVACGERSPHYAPRAANAIKMDPEAPTFVAFYLPQFHPFRENDEWWGKGFTEWTNVTKAVPQFVGHYQPRLPLDLGFYDLRSPDVMREQVALAKLYGIGAFCFHYYWFDGKRLLDKPIENYLADGGETLTLPFCLCWANENWTRRWDGAESDILMKQSHSLEDHARVFDDLCRYFKDPRYLTQDGKPIIVVYRPGIIDRLDTMVDIWRRAATAAGFPGIHLVATNSFGFDDSGSIGFDAIVEFPPHNVNVSDKREWLDWHNPGHEGNVYSYKDVVDFCVDRLKDIDATARAKAYYPTVMTGWDNEARKPGRGHVFHDCTPTLFHQWLRSASEFASRNHSAGNGLVFINAWNEWAEGTYLEPDRKFGHAYLWAARAVLEGRLGIDPAINELVDKANARAGLRTSKGAICVHLFYPDLIDELATRTRALSQAGVQLDLLLSVPQTMALEDIRMAIGELAPIKTLLVGNRGRDVLPFLKTAREALRMGYTYGCKIHSKKSPHVPGGDRWRTSIYDALLTPVWAASAGALFEQPSRCGIYAPEAMLKSCRDVNVMRDNRENVAQLLGEIGLDAHSLDLFVAGTMFWFNFNAIGRALDDRFDDEWFGPELGAIDGTRAHAFERAFVHIANGAGFELTPYRADILDPYKQ
jgi:lipopolysaccharide biosynthesis protein